MRKSIIIPALILSLAATVFSIYAGVNGAPVIGGEDDPLVTLSYINQVLKPQMEADILKKIAGQDIKISDISPAASPSLEYQVVTMKKGELLLPKNSIELIVRPGSKAVIVSPIKENGLLDMTDGAELLDGKSAPINHMLIVPRADGRGIRITTDIAYVMVRGEYEIVK